MIQTHRLAVLQQVARTGSLAGAARTLGLTQPAVAHHVTQLEREAGTPLIVRHGRGVRLTEAGSALAAHADAILARLTTAEEEVAAIAGLRTGRVRLAAFPTAAATLVPRALAALRDRHPGVLVSLEETEPPEALAALRAGEIDLAVTFRYADSPAGNGPDVVPTFLFEDRIDLITAVDHRIDANRDQSGSAPPATLEHLRDATWVAGCERCRSNLVDSCRQAGYEPAIAFTTDDFVTQQALVASGLAVAAIPRSTLGAHTNAGVRTWQLSTLGSRTVEAVVMGDSPSPAVAAIREHLVTVAAET
jgi:molybdate transport repressor ModE-like protein